MTNTHRAPPEYDAGKDDIDAFASAWADYFVARGPKPEAVGLGSQADASERGPLQASQPEPSPSAR